MLPAISHKTEAGSPALTDIEFVGLFEKRIGKRAMYEIAVPLASTDFGGSRSGGLGDIEAAFKYTAYASSTTAAHRLGRARSRDPEWQRGKGHRPRAR